MQDYRPCDPEEDCGNEKYTGKTKPRCNKGLGCTTCWEIYYDYHGVPERGEE